MNWYAWEFAFVQNKTTAGSNWNRPILIGKSFSHHTPVGREGRDTERSGNHWVCLLLKRRIKRK
jgi:hypothetical protein